MLRDSTPVFDPIRAAWNTVAQFDNYAAAQRAVDRLSDNGFPVEKLDIVGSDLRTVERVTGRMTKARAALAGARSGLWIGVLIGVLLGLFTAGSWISVVATAAGLGAAWGAIFGFAVHAATKGERDFSSVRGLSAARYDVIARDGAVSQARSMLAELGLLPVTEFPAR